ncbi:MAG TPA: PfkB family carbohydrate kinase [Aestuariivirga sp.]|nr:PfkB family carbohydrate kinase [Aestuariivirga sp.]
MTRGLLQLSGVVVDILHRVDHLPCSGEEVETPELVMTAGGGFNAVVAARRLGAAVTYGGTLGIGPFAEIVQKHLASEHIPCAATRRVQADQGTCSVIVERSGERSFISYHGAERRVDGSHLESLDAGSFDWILLSGYSLYKPETARAFLPWLESLPRPPLFLFDPGPIVSSIPRAVLDATLARADWVSANAHEAAIITGMEVPSCAAAALAKNRAAALVRTGADGCWLACDGTITHVAGFAVRVLDTNGAGDTHDGAFIAAMMQGLAPLDAARFANAAAALSTTQTGPATSPTLSDTQRFMQSYGAQQAAEAQLQQEDQT